MNTNTNKECNKYLTIIPAYNEEESIGPFLESIRRLLPEMAILVINDASTDRTAAAAQQAGAMVLTLPLNLGVGGAVQTGFQFARDHGYDCVVRCDGDGQHPAEEIPGLIEAMEHSDVDLITGSRFLAEGWKGSSWMRRLGIGYLSLFLSYICKQRVTDPTSGFSVFNRLLIHYFADRYPMDYPEPEALALIRRQGYHFKEIPTAFKERQAGTSSLRRWNAVYYALKVTLALTVDRARSVDQQYARHHLQHVLESGR